ncbi:MAG: hypothetical protein C4547_10970 [Phycisphaerales bacterium]|nr:MAG: hypothetical protein C4547_10970 [Phycisphaerales bacterium]
MCLIVDANRAADTFAAPVSPDAVPVVQWLLRKDGRIVYGGRLTVELFRVEPARRALRELKRAGRAVELDYDAVDSETERVSSTGLCVSDDPHIIAVARVSGARVLFTSDSDLHRDFKNPRLVNGPRGTIYQSAKHADLLRHTAICPGPPSRPGR